MSKKIIATLVSAAGLAAGTLAVGVFAKSPIALVDGAPSTYTVQRGDTLWSIASKFLKSPWQWPEVWRMNNEQVKNPHRIYPGDVIRLDRSGPTLAVDSSASGIIRLSPGVRSTPLSSEIPAIPANAIAPFLTQPLVVEVGDVYEQAPRVLGTEDQRVIVGTGNLIYVDGVAENEGLRWQAFRPGKAIKDPDTGETLGFDAVFLGEARVRKFGSPATLEVTKSVLELNRDDILLPIKEAPFPSYVPRPPDKPMKARILSVQDGVAELAKFSVVAINKGKRDGVEIGHVLATYRPGERAKNYKGWTEFGLALPLRDLEWKRVPVVPEVEVLSARPISPSAVTSGLTEEGRKLRERRTSFVQEGVTQLPDERNGLVFVFRTFDKVSYGLVMQSTRQISVGDIALKP